MARTTQRRAFPVNRASESDDGAMTPEDFRRLALELAEAVESAHLGTPDFRVAGKIFATVSATRGTGVLKFTREQQEMLCAAEPELFSPVPGWWGQSGWTTLQISAADEAGLRNALLLAWRNVAPKRLRATG
jgi:hypothetical protein